MARGRTNCMLRVPRVGDFRERPAAEAPWLFTAGTHSASAVVTLAAFSLSRWPETSRTTYALTDAVDALVLPQE
ncbi:MAG: hypothetical protein AB7K63_21140 [Vicinamibacterales bacterium]